MSAGNSQALIEKIFSSGVLNRLDKYTLVSKYDITGALYEGNAPIRSLTGQSPQTGSVISSIPAQGIVLSTPGTYTFADNLTWTPQATASVAITISSNDVVLDMGNFSLTAVAPDNSQKIVGIYVGSSASGVTIQNGSLVSLCYCGICAETVGALTIQNVTVSGLNYTQKDILTSGHKLECPAGIHIDTASAVTLVDCVVQGNTVTADSSAGVQILRTPFGSVTGCQVSNLINNDGSVQGYSYILSSEIATRNCQADHFQSQFGGNVTTPGHTVIGFVPIFCTNLAFENCTASNMTGCCDDCHGMSVFLDTGVTVVNFKADTVVDGAPPYNTGAKATGLEVYGASVFVANCTAENIKAIHPQDLQGTGFSVWGSNIGLVNCVASNVVVCDENGNKNPALGYGTGFGWAPDPRPEFRNVGAYDVQYVGCSAGDCQVGFDTWYHVNSIWLNVSSTNCGIAILVQPGASRTLSCNPCSECSPEMSATITNIAAGNSYPS